jgi:uncharacterized protein (DUF608 family)
LEEVMSISGKSTRREFLVKTSSATLIATVPFCGGAVPDVSELDGTSGQNPDSSEDFFKAGPQRTFQGDRTTQIAFPLGGIGAGCMCLNGYGGLQDFSIFNHPTLTALPGDSYSRPFGALHIRGSSTITRVLEGSLPPSKVFDQGLQGQGYFRGGAEGLPRFEKCVFYGEYPIAEVALSDPSIPLQVVITGWSPFIPLDAKNSGIPCLILEYTFHNTSSTNVDYEFSYHLPHFASGCKNDGLKSRNTVIPNQGVFLHNVEDGNAEAFGSICLLAIAQQPRIKGMWLRSDWEFDAVAALWREVSTGTFTPNNGSNEIDTRGPNGGSILFASSLSPGESHTYPVVISWYFPNAYVRVGGISDPGEDEDDAVQTNVGCRSSQNGARAPWRPYYASVWSDAREVSLYVKENYTSLRARTMVFKEALFSSTLPPYALDAVSANLAILKSPTVLRMENGNLWGWEGCAADAGCGHGSCTHVWNYAQAFPNLFPQLERTLREQELTRSMDENGHVSFRAALPEGPTKHDYHAASDGQLGGIMKVFREWQISGDVDWLRKMYPLVKRSLDYCIRTWDPEHRGALFEPHHNTYDIEFWGPDSMCTSIYLGALSAFAKMAEAVGETEDAKQYRALAQKCARFLDGTLFNGEYYQQKVQYQGLRDTSFAEMVSHVDERSGEMQKLLKREGPRYQYGSGCLSDGIIGAWMARVYGIETPLKHENVRSSLRSIFNNNFKMDLSQHANVQRPGYAVGHEPGLLLCTWPQDGKPTLPFVYSDEVWTGIEYQVASHLIAEGFVAEGLTIVKGLRSRYDGRIRNPWNEYEYGNYYARAMASYALLGALSGFRYSAVERTLWFGPQLKLRPFTCFFCAASGFGTVTLDHSTLRIQMIEGELRLEKIVLTENGQSKTLEWRGTARPDSPLITNI